MQEPLNPYPCYRLLKIPSAATYTHILAESGMDNIKEIYLDLDLYDTYLVYFYCPY